MPLLDPYRCLLLSRELEEAQLRQKARMPCTLREVSRVGGREGS